MCEIFLRFENPAAEWQICWIWGISDAITARGRCPAMIPVGTMIRTVHHCQYLCLLQGSCQLAVLDMARNMTGWLRVHRRMSGVWKKHHCASWDIRYITTENLDQRGSSMGLNICYYNAAHVLTKTVVRRLTRLTVSAGSSFLRNHIMAQVRLNISN